MAEIDLDRGDPSAAERIAERQSAGSDRSKRIRQTRSESTKKSTGSKRPTASDTSLKSELKGAFDRLAEQREAKGDDELATALKEEAESMAQGLVSLTRTVTFLRVPLLFLLGILVPVLAFWRVGSILLARFAERRARIVAEQELAAAGIESAPPTP